MLDPVIAFLSKIFNLIGNAIGKFILLLLSPFLIIRGLYKRSGWILKGLILVLLLCILLPYGWFFWNAGWTRNFNPDYADQYEFSSRTSIPGKSMNAGNNSCGPSALIEVSRDLINFNVNENGWVPSMLLSKMGFFGIPWKHTPFMDNKAAFQLGINEIMRRTVQEAVDRLGRIRGTSQIDQNLQNARQNIFYTEDLWYFSLSPFGPTTPTPSRYARAATDLNDFNEALKSCDAQFDPRADNLLRFLDQMTNAIGSTSDILSDRITASNAGWFDFRADDRFWFAYGQLYALHGILAAAESDFKDVIAERGLRRTWSEATRQSRRTLDVRPWIISNGGESAFIMPSHLATMGFYLLRVRSNLTEMRDILDR